MEPVLEQIIARVNAAAQAGSALRIRGAGSKDFYAQRLQGEVLDTTAYQGIIDYQPTELVVTLRAGTPLAELESVLAQQGQCLPFEPPHFAISDEADRATVGGMVAAGLSGPARCSVGALREYVLGVQIVNGRGQLLTFGGQVMKNVAGYDVSRLMVGAMGTLGLLTQVSLKVSPLPAAQATLRFEVDQADALAQLHRWGGQPLPLNASSWARASAGSGVLLVRLRGAQAAVRSACAAMTRDLPGAQLDEALAQRHWQDCRDLRLPFFTDMAAHSDGAHLALWRLSLPPTTAVLDLPGPALLEWHGGLRWCWAPVASASALRTLARSHGGHATLFIAPRAMPQTSVARFTPLQQPLLGIHQRLKREFDPAGVFNPGRMYEDC